jgi:hypothetical protein
MARLNAPPRWRFHRRMNLISLWSKSILQPLCQAARWYGMGSDQAGEFGAPSVRRLDERSFKGKRVMAILLSTKAPRHVQDWKAALLAVDPSLEIRLFPETTRMRCGAAGGLDIA